LFLRKKHIEKLSDEQLVIEYQKKYNNKYIGVLYERYYHIVFGVCLKYLKSVENSEDAVILIFEKLMEDLKTAQLSNFNGWLYMVTKNYCLQQLRKKSYYTVDYSVFEEVLKSEEGIAFQKQNEETMYQLLEQKIEELKEEQRICIQLFYLQKNSYAEVTALTGFELKKVKSYIQNGKRKLGLLLKNDYQTLIREEQ
jgi:RNA polymerase sigma-70 factor (ECF subfamily)